MNESRRLKICLAASAGGHLTQLRKIKDCTDGQEIFYVVSTEVVRDSLEKEGRVYVVGECNRQRPWDVIQVLGRCWKAMRTEKPDVVLSTGAAAGCLCCWIGKLMGSKVIWMDSITNVERVSLSGRLVRRIADVFLVQWPELTERYPKSHYAGEVI